MQTLSRDRAYTLLGILLALFLGALDQTIVSTALPRIVEDLHGLRRYDWVATAYLLASTALVPIYGRLADLYNRKTIELAAVCIFLSGSFLCGLAGEFGPLPLLGDGMTQLILFRAVQGLGGAGLFAMAFIIIADLFPPSERGRYQGFVGAVFGIASVLGPLIGGFLTDYGGAIVPGVEGWRWVFYVNLPFGVLALWFITTRMPSIAPKDEHGRLSYLSMVLLIAGLVPLILALRLDKTVYGWGDPVTLALLAVAVVLLALFVVRSLRVEHPILDFGLFRNRVFSASNAALFFLGAAFLSILIFLPLFLVQVLGVSATEAGISLIPLSLGLVSGSIISGQLVSRFGHYRRLMLIGGVILAVGVVLLSQMQADVPYWRVTCYMAICGLGLGPSFPLYTLAVQNAVEIQRLGQATSASQFSRQIGGVIGVAVMGTVFATSLHASFASTMPDVPGRSGEASVAFAAEGGREGGTAVRERIQQQFDQQYERIAQAVEAGDAQALDTLLAAVPLPEPVKTQIRGAASGHDAAASQEVLRRLHATMDRRARQIEDEVSTAMKQAFTDAITRIYLFTLLFVAVAWVVTWFVPELPLRTTLEEGPRPSPEP